MRAFLWGKWELVMLGSFSRLSKQAFVMQKIPEEWRNMVTPPPILSMFIPNEYVLLNQNDLGTSSGLRALGSASDHEGYGDGPHLQGTYFS